MSEDDRIIADAEVGRLVREILDRRPSIEFEAWYDDDGEYAVLLELDIFRSNSLADALRQARGTLVDGDE